MPKAIRIDNGAPLGDPSRKTLPELALWLAAKRVDTILNRPGRPTDNAVVERMQRTTQHWAEVKQAKHLNDLAQKLQHVALIQAQYFKVRRLNNQTRLAVYPELWTNPIAYDPKVFDGQRAYEALADFDFVRKVSITGQITLYYQVYYT